MKRVGHRGDTLIEVMLAVGIFSLVAIAVVAIMNTGTSNVQTSLELTMTRNEIDTQAEALRFIQSAYIAEKDLKPENQVYTKLWHSIVGDGSQQGLAQNAQPEVTQYSPATCQALYDKNSATGIYGQKAFVINTKKLTSNPNMALVKATATNVFAPTLVYPRLIYGTDTGSLIEANASSELTKAEGLYIVAVRDSGSMVVKDKFTSADGNQVTKGATYYDFYIRSCWYGTGADTPSTISTVIRLYDPDMTVVEYKLSTFQVNFDAGGGANVEAIDTAEDRGTHDFGDVTVTVPDDRADDIIGYSTQNPALGPVSCSSVNRDAVRRPDGSWETSVHVGEVSAADRNPTIYAVSSCMMEVTYDANGGSYWKGDVNLNKTTTTESVEVRVGTQQVQVQGLPESSWPKKTGNKIKGWTYPSPNTGTVSWRPTVTITICALNDKNCKESTSVTVYAAWNVSNQYISIYLRWWSPSNNKNNTTGLPTYADLDSYIDGTDANGKSIHVYYSSKTHYANGNLVAYLNHDSLGGTGCKASDGRYEEIAELNTAGGKTYSYYVKEYTSPRVEIKYAEVEVQVFNGTKNTSTTSCNVTGNGTPVATRKYVVNGNKATVTGVDEAGNTVNKTVTITGSGPRLTFFNYLDEHFTDVLKWSSY